MTNKSLVVNQMIDSLGQLPLRWQSQWESMRNEGKFGARQKALNADFLVRLEYQVEEPLNLQAWLEEVYLDPEKSPDLTRDDLQSIGVLIRKLMRFEPQSRVCAKDILMDDWLRE